MGYAVQAWTNEASGADTAVLWPSSLSEIARLLTGGQTYLPLERMQGWLGDWQSVQDHRSAGKPTPVLGVLSDEFLSQLPKSVRWCAVSQHLLSLYGAKFC